MYQRDLKMKKSLALMAFAAAFTSVAHADGMSANVALTSNYKFRGQDQGNNKPALQGGFDFSSSGFYVGNWNSSIGLTNAGLEMDFYGGYKGEAAGLGYDVGVLQYYYPQKNKIAATDYDTTELYGAVTFSILTMKYSHTVSKKYFAVDGGENTGYLDLSANYEVAKGVLLNGHVGYTNLSDDANDIGVPDYADYKIGATYDMGSGYSLAGAVVGATKRGAYRALNNGSDINKARFILTLSKSM
jgi:uncharacterized protein (TIGR02001 family)